MKRIKLGSFMLLLVMGLVMISCNKDETPETTSGDITGVWTCNSVDYTGTTVTGLAGQNMSADFVGEGYNIDFTFVLTENPNSATSEGSYDIKLTTTILGQSTVQEIPDNAFAYIGTWSREGNKLTITQGGESSVATIAELTDSFLELNMTDERVITNQGVTATTTTDMVVTFSK